MKYWYTVLIFVIILCTSCSTTPKVFLHDGLKPLYHMNFYDVDIFYAVDHKDIIVGEQACERG